jgi:fermentation-respiration switch protein FrsA (DUF1100 family)
MPGGSSLRRFVGVVALRSDDFWDRSWKRRMARRVVFGAYGYVGVLLVLLALENWFLFHPSPAAGSWEPPPDGMPVEDVRLTGADGTSLHAWWTAPDGWQPAQGAVLYCHGNAGNLSHRGYDLRGWRGQMNLAVLIFDYPGYGHSGGKPTEAGCYAAGEAAYDWLTRERHVPGERILLYGGSLGGAVATDLASRRPHRALVLVSAFTSFPDMAQKQFPWLPGRWLVRNQFDNLGKIARCRGPVVVAHGTEDGLVPFAQGERLFAAAREPKLFVPRLGVGHTDGSDPDLFAALRRFLQQVESSEQAPSLETISP